MKYLHLILLALVLTGCNFNNIEIIGTAPGMDGSTVFVKDKNNKIIYGENIEGGKFHIVQQPLKDAGYYTLSMSKPNRNYEIYLEPGKYNIAIDTGAKPKYPAITSSSAIQSDLAIYHRYTDSIMQGIRGEANKWMNKFNSPEAMQLPDKEYQDLLAKVKIWQDKLAAAKTTILSAFVNKYPNNKVIPHAMNKMGLEDKAPMYYAIYEKLGDEVKNSDEGKKLGDKLKSLVKLMSGATAPELEGITSDGKKISVKHLHKKAVIIAFWRSGYSMKDDHFALVNTLLPSLDSTKVGVIGVSFDTDRSKWIETIKKRGLTFWNISDLKGDDSPNVKNWNITDLPFYFILDGNGRILYKCISYQELVLDINEYLRKN